MAGRSVLSAFYVAIFLMYSYTLWYDWNYVEIGHGGYGGKFKFLTFWNVVLQTVYFGMCVMTLFTGADVAQSSGLRKMRDTVHTTLAFPVGALVVLAFWGLYAVDRELIYPKALDALIPSWLNHAMVMFWGLYVMDRDLIFPESRARHVPPLLTHVTHTTVLPLLLMEKCVVFHHHPRTHNAFFILLAFCVIYISWILWIAYAADLWVYPVLEVLENHERAIFLLVLSVVLFILYLLGRSVTMFLWQYE